MRGSRTIAAGIGLASLLVIVVVGAGPLMSQVERPVYAVVRSDGPLEVRTYPAMIVAQTVTTGGRRSAIGEGFGIIAGYIFGGNAIREKVAMTAPVLQQRTSADPPKRDGAGSWAIRLIMPRSWSLGTLPRPDDPRVSLVRQPAATFAVIRFSGLAGDAAIAAKTRELVTYLGARNLQSDGQPMLAFYDPPWTLPFLRRNEILIAVKAE